MMLKIKLRFVLISLLFVALLFFSNQNIAKAAYGPDDFVTTWKTDNIGSSNSDQVEIRTYPGETYNYYG